MLLLLPAAWLLLLLQPPTRHVNNRAGSGATATLAAEGGAEEWQSWRAGDQQPMHSLTRNGIQKQVATIAEKHGAP